MAKKKSKIKLRKDNLFIFFLIIILIVLLITLFVLGKNVFKKTGGNVEEVKGLNNIEGKFKSFGFNTITVDGHNFSQLIDAFETAKMTKGMPTIIIAKTIKGKGVSFMENKVEWHGKAPNEEEYKQAMAELTNIFT